MLRLFCHQLCRITDHAGLAQRPAQAQGAHLARRHQGKFGDPWLDNYRAVNFDDVWHLAGYSRKDHAKHALKKESRDGEIILPKIREVSGDPTGSNKATSKRGPAPETILLTVQLFKRFCLAAPGEQGRAIREYYVELEESVADVLEGVRRGEISMAR